MHHYRSIFVFAFLVVLASAGWAFWKQVGTDEGMTAAADKYLATLTDEQRSKSLVEYTSERRVDWHFIPKDYRKGLQIKEMNDGQRQAALALLRASLSEVGYDKATKIMALEAILHALETSRDRGPLRDPERYYFTVFGQPARDSRWGLSVEGHHLSLNFVVEEGQVVSSTPTMFGANPATVKNEIAAGLPLGTRVLAEEEQLAFDLLDSLTHEQRARAVIAKEAPREIRAAGEPQPPTNPPEGIALSDLNQPQRQMLRALVTTYANNLPADVADQRLQSIKEAGVQAVHFAWAGAQKPGVGHYYRIQGPTFLVEFVNTQPDAAGNPANHIHCVWRDMRGDFAMPIQSP